MRNKLIVGIALIVLLLVGGYLYNKYQVAPRVKFNALELYDINGKPFNNDELKGKKVFVNFFATWCGPCMREWPVLETTQAILEKEGYLFIAISDEPVEKLARFAERKHTNIRVLYTQQKLNDLKIFSVPTSYLLNEKQEIVLDQTGEFEGSPAHIAEQLRKAFK
jgi:thiol-disulfide isomerase/thioredoxin